LTRNQTVLEGKVASRDTLRTTPGGVAALHLTLIHQSTQREGKTEVAVEVEMNAVAFGELAETMNSVKDGDSISIKGFLSQKNRFSPMPILHITQFKFSER
jgi:primosomal replication protein N